jgi:hypothetical protein
MLEIGVHDGLERPQALSGVLEALLRLRTLLRRVLPVGDGLAQRLGSSPCLGEPDPYANSNPAPRTPHTDTQAPTQAPDSFADAQAGHVTIALSGSTRFGISRPY